MYISKKEFNLIKEKILVEIYDLKRISHRDDYVLSMFKDPVELSLVLNQACSECSINCFDEEIADLALNNPRLSRYYKDFDGQTTSLGLEDKNKVKGVLVKILSKISKSKKNLCNIEPLDVKNVTDKIKSFSDVGL